jgi:arylformamidase
LLERSFRFDHDTVIAMPLLDRRRFVSVLAWGAPALARQRIGPPPHEKGPKVYLDYDQVELDAAYDQTAYAPNRRQVEERIAATSELVRARLGAPVRASYGPTEIERLDIYRTPRPRAPVHVFVHGGAWRAGSARGNAFAAEVFVAAGAHFIAPDFAAVQDAGGSLMPMADQVRRAIAWVYRNAASFGGDPERIYVSGHSSGAHLAGVAVTTDWRKDFGLPAGLIKGALLASGMYDLKGPRLSSRNTYVKFDDATEEALSPQRHIDRLSMPLIVAYGSLETPEFQRQSRDFAAAVKAAGKPVELLRCENYNHFELMETLANPYSPLAHAALGQMKLV